VELLARAMVIAGSCSPSAGILFSRLAEAVLLLAEIRFLERSLAGVGLGKGDIVRGIKTGAAWSLVFGGAAAAAGALLLAAGVHPLRFFEMWLPAGKGDLLLFLLTGALISPFVEELFFRGLLYGFFRRWGVALGLILTTAVFAGLHLPGLPVTQAIGGLVFCLAYEKGKSLLAPYIIHALGNAAIFGLGMLGG
jgi:membrane protease YdiL (CAAX protease family)